MRSACLAVLLGTALCGAPASAQPAAPAAGLPDGKPVIPPGNEALLTEMLKGGGSPPGGCVLDSASIERIVVIARYTCGDKRGIEIQLGHVSRAPDATDRTSTFAIRRSADAPPALVIDLVKAIREREGRFRWETPTASPGGVKAPGRTLPKAVIVIAAAAIGVTAWWLFRRRRAPGDQPTGGPSS